MITIAILILAAAGVVMIIVDATLFDADDDHGDLYWEDEPPS